MSIRERDTQLDAYRALTMIYILCVIHIAYWFGAIGEPTKSWILVEMPVIFFISGAALQVSNKKRSLGQTIVNRAKRVILPYYAYAFVCCIIGICVLYISGDIGLLNCLKMVAKALIPYNEVLPVRYAYHLWFIIPYMFLSCIFGVQIKHVNKIPPPAFMILLLLLCIGTQLVTGVFVIREIVFYNFFFVAGYLYYRRLSVKQIFVCLLLSAIVFTGAVANFRGKGYPKDDTHSMAIWKRIANFAS